MFWKSLVLAFCVVGAYADLQSALGGSGEEALKDKLREQCEKVNAGDKTDEVANSVKAFIECGKNLINPEQLKKEIEDAKPNGALDEVFKKYCAKTSQLKSCIHTLLDGVIPCLDETSKGYISSAKGSTDQLIDFVCYKDGDRIALFIAEQGPECITSKAEPIRECAKKMQEANKDKKIEDFTIQERCSKFDELSACMVTALEGCDTPTPANMAESLFKYVRKSSPCNEALPKN